MLIDNYKFTIKNLNMMKIQLIWIDNNKTYWIKKRDLKLIINIYLKLMEI